jgi:cation diffusion facilitator family transporter
MAGGSSEKPIAVYGAIAANGFIAIAKFAAALITGSAAMIAEGVHSIVDTGNQALLLLGIRQSKQPADEQHPFGHGKALYFWSLIVAMLLFSAGGGVAIYEGVTHLLHPGALEDPFWNYVVLGVAVVAEGASWVIALREFFHAKGEENFWRAVRTSKDPTTVTVIFKDSAALAGLIIAFLGIYFGHLFNNPYLDGIASITIGAVLVAVAIFLTYESRGLLLGESAGTAEVESIRALAEGDPAVERVRQPLTMHFGPKEILLNLDIQFRKDLTAAELESAVDRLEKKIRDKHPDVKHIFIEAESLTGHHREVVKAP